jgi:hypothetical protein
MAFSMDSLLIYLSIPFAPTFFLAATLLAVRSFFAYMDNPLRFVLMAMVQSSERGSATGVTNGREPCPSASARLSHIFNANISSRFPIHRRRFDGQ